MFFLKRPSIFHLRVVTSDAVVVCVPAYAAVVAGVVDTVVGSVPIVVSSKNAEISTYFLAFKLALFLKLNGSH